MTRADLGRKSVRRNALIADLLHRIDFIERAGTGVKRIRDEVRERGYPEPEWEAKGFVTTIFRPNPEVQAAAGPVSGLGKVAPEVAPQVAPEVTPEVTPEVERLLRVLRGTMDRQSLQAALGLKAEKNFRLVYLRPALAAGLITMTIPDKPRSSRQRYRLTEAGRAYLTTSKGLEAVPNAALTSSDL